MMIHGGGVIRVLIFTIFRPVDTIVWFALRMCQPPSLDNKISNKKCNKLATFTRNREDLKLSKHEKSREMV